MDLTFITHRECDELMFKSPLPQKYKFIPLNHMVLELKNQKVKPTVEVEPWIRNGFVLYLDLLQESNNLTCKTTNWETVLLQGGLGPCPFTMAHREEDTF